MAFGAERVVYYPFDLPEEWLICQVLRQEPNGAHLLRCRGQDHSVTADKAHLICPRRGHHQVARDLAGLSTEPVNLEHIEDTIRHHFCSGLTYMGANDITLAVNPFRELRIYDDTWIGKYAALDPDLPPHIYSAAARAYKDLHDAWENQTVIFLGETFSGKTTALQHTLDFMVSTTGDGDQLDDSLNMLLKLLHPFIGLRTLDNEASLSTRALLCVDLWIDATGFTCAAGTCVDLLEIGRLDRLEFAVGHNYDCLYLALKHPSASTWVGTQEEFCLLGEAAEVKDWDRDGSMLAGWTEALEAFGLDVAEVVRVLCGILLLGELQMSPTPADPLVPTVSPSWALHAAAAAFGVSVEQLTSTTFGGCAAARTAHSEGWKAALFALIQDTYRRLVALVQSAANARLSGEVPAGEPFSPAWGERSRPEGAKRIRLMEVPALPGELDRPGAFEMLQSQWLSESVQAELIAAALNHRQGEAGVADFSFRCQAAKKALDVIAGPQGLVETLVALRDMPLGEDPQVQQVFTRWASAQTSAAVAFPVSSGVRCAITGACGTMDHMLDSQLARGSVGAQSPPGTIHELSRSPCGLVAAMFGAPSLPRGVEAVRHAIGSLTAAMRGEGSRPWLVCCVRPNAICKPGMISKKELLPQLQRFRITDVVNCSQAPAGRGYTTVWPLKAFRQLYSHLVPSCSDGMDHADAAEVFMRAVCGRSGEGSVGPECVYGTEELLRKLEDARLGVAALAIRTPEEDLKEEMRLSLQAQQEEHMQRLLALHEQHRLELEQAVSEVQQDRHNEQLRQAQDRRYQELQQVDVIYDQELDYAGGALPDLARLLDRVEEYKASHQLELDETEREHRHDLHRLREVISAPSASLAVDQEQQQPVSGRAGAGSEAVRSRGSGGIHQDSVVGSAASSGVARDAASVAGDSVRASSRLAASAASATAEESARASSGLARMAATADAEIASSIVRDAAVWEAEDVQQVEDSDRYRREVLEGEGCASASAARPASGSNRTPSSRTRENRSPRTASSHPPSHSTASPKQEHVELHQALVQMASVLRVSREQEDSHKVEIDALRQETDAWRLEADRLWSQVQDLKKQLKEKERK